MAKARSHIRSVEVADDSTRTLKDGGGDGTFDAMEARVKALEDRFEKMDSKLDTIIGDISSLRTDLAYLKGKVDSMPTSLQLLGFAVAVFVAAGLIRYIAP